MQSNTDYRFPQREEFPWHRRRARASTPEEMFLAEDYKRAINKGSLAAGLRAAQPTSCHHLWQAIYNIIIHLCERFCLLYRNV